MARPELLSESQIRKLAQSWIESDAQERVELLKEYRISKPTLYRTMRRHGLEFQTSVKSF